MKKTQKRLIISAKESVYAIQIGISVHKFIYSENYFANSVSKFTSHLQH